MVVDTHHQNFHAFSVFTQVQVSQVALEVDTVARLQYVTATVLKLHGQLPFNDKNKLFAFVLTEVTGITRFAGEHAPIDRKSPRLNSSHVKNSYAVFCL